MFQKRELLPKGARGRRPREEEEADGGPSSRYEDNLRNGVAASGAAGVSGERRGVTPPVSQPSDSGGAGGAVSAVVRGCAARGNVDDEGEAMVVRAGAARKRKKPVGVATGTSKKGDMSGKFRRELAYEGSKKLNIGNDSKATATADWDTEKEKDHRAVMERAEKIGQEILSGQLERGVYRGEKAYAPVINRREGAVAASKYTGVYGPVRGSSYARMTMRVDFNPEICKDYKETGYCGRGDTCIFLHDRTDYKSGWQLEKEWEEQQKKKQDALQRRAIRALSKQGGGDVEDRPSDDASAGSDSSDEDGEDSLPFACLICRKKWHRKSNPVVTNCNHYFCELCAMEHYKTTSKCAACHQATNGIFNSADDIMKKFSSKMLEASEGDADSDNGDEGDDVVDDGDEGGNGQNAENGDHDRGDGSASLA